MPELADLEVFRRYLDRTAIRHRVVGVSAPRSRVLKTSPQRLRKELEGRRVAKSQRYGKYGKYLFVEPEGRGKEPVLMLHFGMTGFLNHYRKAADVSE